jgi:DNA-binding NarL/FixJ family response regulator
VLGEQLVGRLNGEGHNAPHTELSQREFQIFCKLAGGKAVSRVADELLLSVTTVSTYRSRVLEKMNMKSNANITYYAIKHGLI